MLSFEFKGLSPEQCLSLSELIIKVQEQERLCESDVKQIAENFTVTLFHIVQMNWVNTNTTCVPVSYTKLVHLNPCQM